MASSSKPTPPSPSASFYDLSDDEEGGYNTITHASSIKGVQLLFPKSKVYGNPNPSARLRCRISPEPLSIKPTEIWIVPSVLP